MIAVVCSVCMFAASLAGCGSNAEDSKTSESEEKSVELSIAHIGALESPSNLAVEHFIEIVEEKSGGSITITNYPASQLGGDRDILEGIVGGSVDMGIPAAGMTALYLPEYYIFDTPYMFDSEEHLMDVSEGELGEEIADKLLDTAGVRVLAQNWERGTRQCIFTNDVEDLEDFKGVKIRLPEIDSYLKGFELLGTKPTIISFNETLSDNQKKILQEAAVEAGEYQNEILHEKEAEYLEKMKGEGVKVYEPDLAPFKEKAEPMFEEMEEVWGEGLYEKVLSYSKESE